MPAAKTAARYFFSVTIFALILYLFDANDVLPTVAAADFASIAIAVGITLSAQFFAAMRLKQLLALQDIPLAIQKVFSVGLSATFYGLVIPAGNIAAFAVRFAQLSRNSRVESVVAALVADRVIATVFLVVIGVVAVAVDQVAPLWAGVVVAGAVLGVGVLLVGRRSFMSLVERLENIARNQSSGRLHRIAFRISMAFLAYSKAQGSQVLIVLVTALLGHLCGCLSYYAIATGSGLDFSFVSACWIRSGMILATMIPISVAGLGLREVAAIGLIVPLGFAEPQAIGFSILIFIATSVITGLIGGFGELLRAISHP